MRTPFRPRLVACVALVVLLSACGKDADERGARKVGAGANAAVAAPKLEPAPTVDVTSEPQISVTTKLQPILMNTCAT